MPTILTIIFMLASVGLIVAINATSIEDCVSKGNSLETCERAINK